MRDFIKAARALSDDTRVRMLKLLLVRECCVCEVIQALQISQTRASRNLGILEDAGFVRSRRNGAWVDYAIDEEGMNSHCRSLVEVLRHSLGDDATLARDRERLNRAVRRGPGFSKR